MYHFFKNNQANKYFVYFLLLSLFCSGPFAYSAELFKNYIEIKLGSAPNKFLGNAEIIPNNSLANNKSELTSKSVIKNNVDRKKSAFETVTNFAVYNADLKEGNIGINKKGDFDFIYDNIFKVNINENELAGKEIYLSYDIKGIDKSTLPSKSVNFNKVVGGYVVKFSNEWQNVQEKINVAWLKNGLNTIYFTLPDDALYIYKIKNLKIFAKEKIENHLIELKNLIGYKTNDKNIYLNGFINLPSQLENSGYTLSANDKSVKIVENQFEDKITSVNNKDVVLKLFKNNVLVDIIEVKVAQFIKADRNYDLEPLDSKNAVMSNVVVAKNYALYEDKIHSIEELRNIDVPQFESSFINVTKSKTAYRVNNLKVKDSTAFKLFMEYDSLLIPNGYTEKDIQTFHFDTDYKKWIPVEKDSLIESKNVVVALSDKEGDYVNGIIQVPESPQSSSFTPTMMSDIKAADPSAEMTIISPPQVSQKGDANISYPIKIPSGRNGMQPNVGISYNSDGGNGWLGQGWNMSTPAISIDSKWGTPTFDVTKESEMYTLNGEQLMYPKYQDKDWMPNRHYDVNGAPVGTFSTQDIPRVANQVFTPRKQGSFTKIERIGTLTTDYIWKVTSTDGTISWYGGKNGVVSNAVIKNSQNNIVHWALYMVEDIHGNTMKYEYTNTTIPSQSGQNANLTGGIVFNIKNIRYTGFNDADYQYEVLFNSTATIRQDIGISARLGVKQVEPYLLDNIVVQKVGASLPIRSYKLNYGLGKFNKGQLRSVAEYDKNGNFFYEHNFDYYDDVSLNGSDVYFSEGIEEIICEEQNQCPDTDNDGVCNDVDLCPTIPGPVSNNGCPQQGTKCFNTTANVPYTIILETGTNVNVNGVLLPGSPFTTFLGFKSAMELNHPTCSFVSLNATTFLIKIENTNTTYLNISFTNSNQTKSYDFIDCGFGRQSNKIDYAKYFANLSNQNQFALNNGIDPNNPCTDYLTNEEFLIPGYMPSFDSSASELGSSKSEAMSAGFYIGIGIGKNRFTKMTTFGVQWNWGNDKSIALTSLIDINGDGLEDIVSKEGDNLFWKKHIVTRTYNSNNQPVVVHSFGLKSTITGMDNFYRSFGRNRSSNFQITFGLKKIGGFIGWDKSKNKSETDIYYTDGNGDGLMDIVRDGVVYFNRLDGNGNPNFIPDSKGTENLIISASPTSISVPNEYNQEDITLPAFDVVKVWEAPADGNIKIDNNIQLTDTTKNAVVSVEMKKPVVQNSSCYRVTISLTYSDLIQLVNKRYKHIVKFEGRTYNSGCINKSFKINFFQLNGANYLPPNNLYYTNFNGTNTINSCPNIASSSFTSNVSSWLLSSPLNSFLDSQSNLTVYNNSSFNQNKNIFDAGFSFNSNFQISNLFTNSIFNTNHNAPFTVSGRSIYTNIVSGDSNLPLYLNGNLVQNTFPNLLNTNSYSNPGNELYNFINSYYNGTGVSASAYNNNFSSTNPNLPIFVENVEISNPTVIPTSITILGKTFYFQPYNCGTGRSLESKLLNDNSIYNNFRYDSFLKTWFNEDFNKITDLELIDELNNLKQSQSNSDDFVISFMNSSRTINQTNCNETPNELCLLYGSQLNATNSTVTNSLTTNCSGQTLAVKKGERIYFRVHSNSTGNSPVNWNPKVEYTNAGYNLITDANGTKPFSSSFSDSFVLNTKQGLPFPGNSGTAKFTWNPIIITPTDRVTYQIIKKTITAPISGNDDLITPVEEIIYSKVCNPNVSATIATTTNSLPYNLNNITVSLPTDSSNLTQTFFVFRVISTSNINWKVAEWKPEVEFTTTTTISPNQDGSNPEGNITSVTKAYPVPDYDIYRFYPCGNKFEKTIISPSPNQKINADFSGVFNSSHNGIINFVVKRGGLFKGSKTYKITNGVVSVLTSYPYATSLPIELGSAGVGIPNDIEIMFTVDDSENDTNAISLLNTLALTSINIVKITQGNSPNGQVVPKSQITLYQKTNLQFGNFYRSWGQFMYRPTNVVGALPTGIASTKLIKEEALFYSLSSAEANQLNTDLSGVNDSMTTSQLEAFANTHMNFINSVAFLPANAERKLFEGQFSEKWIGFHSENYAAEFSERADKMEESIVDFEENYPNIEQGVLQTGAYSISKYNTGYSNNNFSAGINGWGFGVNGSISNNGLSNSLTDYVDYNGDRYPDIVSKDFIQYTNRTGGLKPSTPNDGQNVSVSSSDSFGFGASGSFAKSNDDKGDSSSKGNAFKRFVGFLGNQGAGISGNFSNGNSVTQRLWTDVNGDGLSDLVYTTNAGTNVKLNYGPTTPNSFETNWGNLPLFNSKSNGVSGGLGVNKWQGSTEAGISLTTSWNKATNTLADINGDGLLDLIYADNDLGVKLNLGNQFIDKGVWSSSYNLKKESSTVGASLNVGFTYAFVWKIFGINFKIPAININGIPLSTSTNRTLKAIKDYDGDGYADLLEKTGVNRINVYHSRIRRTDKLKTVTNPLGGTFTIDYRLQPVTYNNPDPKWAMSSIEVSDNYDKVNDGEDTYKKHFEYIDGKYDRREREFYGYKEVRIIDYTTNEEGNEEVYRTSVSKYNNSSYFLNGLAIENYIIKGSDENQKYSRTLNTYKVYTLNSLNDEILLNDQKPDTYDVGGHEGRRSAAVLLTKTRSEVYELNPTADLVTEVEFTYDNKGRITEYLNKGDVSNTTDDYKSVITYHTGLESLNIINIPKSIEVTVLDTNTVKRKRTTEVNSVNGKITKVSAINGTASADTEMKYDIYGNLTDIKYPNNTNGEAMSYTYTYDTAYNKYIEKVKDNAFGYESITAYNTDFDKPIEVTDIAGNKSKYFYDDFGRTTKVVGPKEIAANLDYTIKFEYFPYINLLPSDAGASTTNFMPVAKTQHFDVQHPDNPIETYTFVDGLGRPAQVKKDIELNTGNTTSPTYTEALTISGKTKVDAYARTIEAFQPWWEEKGPATKFIINEQAVTISSKVIYDELDRAIKSIDEEGNISTVQFAIAPDVNGINCLKTTSDVDQNGTQHIISETYHDASGKLLSTKNVGGTTGSIWTKFKYNAIGELLTYTDAENITTAYTYDMFGRKVEVKHPDNGRTLYKYDNVNLVSIQTQNLIASSKFIKYEYDHSRLMSVIFPVMPSGANLSNVKYKYGNSGNETGRVVAIYDATGVQNLKYGVMGETTEIKRTIVAPNLPTRIFTTKFDYDSFNRIQNLIYPDGESVSYLYNRGGNLNKMRTQLNGTDYEYVKQIDYDYFEQKTYMKYGNNTETHYNYSPELRRLQNLNVKAADGQNMFNNIYSYDKVGNITNINNAAVFNTTNYMGGSYNNEFSYDNLNRLTAAKGNFTGYTVGRINQDNQKNYELEMKYNDTHGIVQKKQLNTTQGYVPVYENSYTNNYAYQANTHKAIGITNTETNVEEQFKYDGNGNMVANSNPDSFRQMFWDESNRLRVVNDNNNQLQHYIYDAGGERTLKASSQIETVYQNGQIASASSTIGLYTTYVNPYMVVDADQRYSKHYFNGSQRIVSKMGEQDVSIFEEALPIAPQTQNTERQSENSTAQTSEETVDFEVLRNLQINDFNYYLTQNIENTTAKSVKVKYKEFKKEAKETERASENITQAAPNYVEMFYYHSDHLGSGTFLSDSDGNPYQFFLNLPFGETMIEQHSYSGDYTNRYKFNGKELDEETGFYYYGARYYNPKFSIWLSVDPMKTKYSIWNPYNYCLQNPVNLIDPDGLEPTPLEAALMASHVYDGKIKLEGGWKESPMGYWNEYNNSSGLKGVMYERFTAEGVSEYAFVFAGTEDISVDGLEDIKQIAGYSEQYKKAQKMAQEMSNYIGNNQKLTFVGHSLGGGLANFSSLVTGRSSITVNPAWVSTATYVNAMKLKKIKKLRKGCFNLNLIHQSDPLHRIQVANDLITKITAPGTIPLLQHVGKDQYIQGGLFSNVISGHLINTAVERMFENGGWQTKVHKGDREDTLIHASPRDF